MSDLERCERENIAKLHAYHDLVRMEVREGQRDRARYWRRIAHAYACNIRLLRSAV